MNEDVIVSRNQRGRPRGSGPTRADRIGFELRQKIFTGKLLPGDRLPTEQELARRYGVAVMTIRHAQRPLLDEGLICKRRRLGTFVSDQVAKQRRLVLVCGVGPHSGVACMEMFSPYYANSIRFCHEEANARGLVLETIWQWSYADVPTTPNRADVFSKPVSGFIFLGCDERHPLLQRARLEGIQHVNLGKTIEGDRTIWFDMAEAASLAWGRMREEVMNRGLPVVVVSVRGEDGGVEALARLVPGGIRHLRVPNHLSVCECERWSCRYIRKLCVDAGGPLAFVFLDDILARGGARVLFEAGWYDGRCPVAVISGKQELGSYGLPVTHIMHDTELEARWAVEMLLAQIEGDAAGAASRRSPFMLAPDPDRGREEGRDPGANVEVSDLLEHLVAVR